jgi:NAD(P)-dependent dehydrogenase (short-subunit alcohol dehydrogenase family)
MIRTIQVHMIRIVTRIPPITTLNTATTVHRTRRTFRAALLRALRLTGIYRSTKWAIKGLSESLRIELGHFGVRVIVVEHAHAQSMPVA